MNPEISNPLLGGILIGAAASLLLLTKGRVFGISGIVGGIVTPKSGDVAWRIAAVSGFIASGIILLQVLPESVAITAEGSVGRYVAAGLLVGFGTQLGSGCTSGHGVCGISRFSPRSIVATITFIATGVATVAALRALGVIT